jgi:WD40 repeat protein
VQDAVKDGLASEAPQNGHAVAPEVPAPKVEAKTTELEAGPAPIDAAQKWKSTDHDNDVFRSRFLPDGTRLVTGSFDKTVRAWDAATGMQVWQGDHEREVISIAVSGDGKLVASGDGMMDRLTDNKECDVKVWDAASGTPVASFRPDGISVRQLAFLSDHHTLLVITKVRSGDVDSTSFSLWDAAQGTKSGDWPKVDEDLHAFAVSPDGKWIVGGGFDSEAHLWRVETKSLAGSLNVQSGVNDMAFSPDGKQIVVALSGSAGNGFILWSIPGGPAEHFLKPGQEIDAAAFDVEGAHVIFKSDDTINWFDTRTRKVASSIKAPSYNREFTLSPTGAELAVLDANNILLLDVAALVAKK